MDVAKQERQKALEEKLQRRLLAVQQQQAQYALMVSFFSVVYLVLVFIPNPSQQDRKSEANDAEAENEPFAEILPATEQGNSTASERGKKYSQFPVATRKFATATAAGGCSASTEATEAALGTKRPIEEVATKGNKWG